MLTGLESFCWPRLRSISCIRSSNCQYFETSCILSRPMRPLLTCARNPAASNLRVHNFGVPAAIAPPNSNSLLYAPIPRSVPLLQTRASNSNDRWSGDFDDEDSSIPPPSNLPTDQDAEEENSDDVQSALSSSRLHRSLQERRERYEKLLAGPRDELLREIPFCYVVLFRQRLKNGREEEGIYSMALPYELPSGEREVVQIILAFEDKDDCEGAAAQLADYTEFKPIVERIPTHTLMDFAEDAEYQVQLEPRGSTFLAPDVRFGEGSGNATGKTDWEQSMEIREKGVRVVSEEAAAAGEAMGPEQEELRKQLNKLWESS